MKKSTLILGTLMTASALAAPAQSCEDLTALARNYVHECKCSHDHTQEISDLTEKKLKSPVWNGYEAAARRCAADEVRFNCIEEYLDKIAPAGKDLRVKSMHPNLELTVSE